MSCETMKAIQAETLYRRSRLTEFLPLEQGLFHLELLRVCLEAQKEHIDACAACEKEVIGNPGMESLKALQVPTFQVDGVSLFGKLVQLVDYDPEDEQEKGFWGELILSDGESWRVQFKTADAATATPLFRKQVQIVGKAVYYRVKTPKIVAESIIADPERDYESAFDEIFGSYKNVFKADLATLLKRVDEEE